MIYSSILVIILYSNFASLTHFKNTAEYYEKIWSGHYVYKEGAYPYFCSIGVLSDKGGEDRIICGGSLLGNRIVITAAHCLSNTTLIPNYRILPNFRNTRLWYSEDEVFKIAGYEIHPDANDDDLHPHAHDIAIVLLDKPDNRSIDYLLPPITPLLRSLPVKMMGYGYTESGVMPIRMKEATVHILDETECMDQTSQRHFSPGDNLCTSNSFGAASCDGDLGGPLVWENPQNNKSYLYGVLTARDIPCKAFGISIFVDVLMHLDFIGKAIARLTSQESRSDQT